MNKNRFYDFITWHFMILWPTALFYDILWLYDRFMTFYDFSDFYDKWKRPGLGGFRFSCNLSVIFVCITPDEANSYKWISKKGWIILSSLFFPYFFLKIIMFRPSLLSWSLQHRRKKLSYVHKSVYIVVPELSCAICHVNSPR
jgi:hypothetical protein